MRWNGLFADLEAQAAALESADRAAEIEDRGRYEAGRLRLVDRLRPAVGLSVRVDCAGGLTLRGPVSRVGPDWLLLREAAGEALIALAAVEAVMGLTRLGAVPKSEHQVDARLGIQSALRGVARDRSGVRVHQRNGTVVDGTIDRVGADFVEVAVHAAGELRRRQEVREVALIAMAGITAVRQRSQG